MLRIAGPRPANTHLTAANKSCRRSPRPYLQYLLAGQDLAALASGWPDNADAAGSIPWCVITAYRVIRCLPSIPANQLSHQALLLVILFISPTVLTASATCCMVHGVRPCRLRPGAALPAGKLPCHLLTLTERSAESGRAVAMVLNACALRVKFQAPPRHCGTQVGCPVCPEVSMAPAPSPRFAVGTFIELGQHASTCRFFIAAVIILR